MGGVFDKLFDAEAGTTTIVKGSSRKTKRKNNMTTKNETYNITNNLLTTPSIPFGQSTGIIQSQVDLGSVDIYASLDGTEYDLLVDSLGQTISFNVPSDRTVILPDETFGINFLKLVSTNSGVVILLVAS